MVDVSLDVDPAMLDNMRREADEHGFDDLDGYVQWLLQHRDTVLNEHDVWDAPPGAVDPDADLSKSSGPALDPDFESEGGPTLDPAASAEADPAEEAAVELPDEEEGADDDDIAAALEEVELEDDEE